MNRKNVKNHKQHIRLCALQPETRPIPEITKPYSLLMNASTKAQQLVVQAYIRLLSIQAAGDEAQAEEWTKSCLSLLCDASELIVDAQRDAEEMILQN